MTEIKNTARLTLLSLNATLRDLGGRRSRLSDAERAFSWIVPAIAGDPETPPLEQMKELADRDPQTYDEIRVWIGMAAWHTTETARNIALADPEGDGTPEEHEAYVSSYMTRANQYLEERLPEIVAKVASFIAAAAAAKASV